MSSTSRYNRRDFLKTVAPAANTSLNWAIAAPVTAPPVTRHFPEV
jgi:hypothetical protein